MIDNAFLLNLLQFVALVAPALAILMQVVMTIEDDRNLEIGPFSIDELKILQLSLIIILLGGAMIGGRLILAIESTYVAIGMSLIFGGLPFSAIAIALMANKSIYKDIDTSGTLTDELKNTFKTVVSISSVTLIPVLMYSMTFSIAKEWMNTTIDFGAFNEGPIPVSMFFAVGFAIMSIKSLQTVFQYDLHTSYDLKKAINLGFRNGLYLPLLLVVFTAPLYFIAYILTTPILIDTLIERSHPVLNVAHLWAAILYYVIFAHDYDPLQENE